MTLTNFTGADSPAAYQWSSTAWVDLEAGVDGVQTIRTDSPVTNATVVFDGLNPGSLYRIEVVAAVPFSAGIDFFDGSSYEVNGSAATRNSDNSFPFDSTDWNLQLATFFPAWMIWDDVAPSSGEITLTVLPNGTHPVFGDVGVINAIRLEETAIPEPTAAILLFLGVFAASFRRNRARS
ncbi:MAG: PEP-CTERM sorting domain-containing protein [Verrucomicrobiota bacterium]